MRPDRDFRAAAVPLQMRHERVECFRHVAVAQVPGQDVAKVHRAVVFLRIHHEARILLGKEQLVLGNAPVAASTLRRAALQLDELT
ncbi:MAG TPA: hypothetical protein VGK58_10275, partial [Lacipirellulaceae bacterium]